MKNESNGKLSDNCFCVFGVVSGFMTLILAIFVGIALYRGVRFKKHGSITAILAVIGLLVWPWISSMFTNGSSFQFPLLITAMFVGVGYFVAKSRDTERVPYERKYESSLLRWN